MYVRGRGNTKSCSTLVRHGTALSSRRCLLAWSVSASSPSLYTSPWHHSTTAGVGAFVLFPSTIHLRPFAGRSWHGMEKAEKWGRWNYGRFFDDKSAVFKGSSLGRQVFAAGECPGRSTLKLFVTVNTRETVRIFSHSPFCLSDLQYFLHRQRSNKST